MPSAKVVCARYLDPARKAVLTPAGWDVYIVFHLLMLVFHLLMSNLSLIKMCSCAPSSPSRCSPLGRGNEDRSFFVGNKIGTIFAGWVRNCPTLDAEEEQNGFCGEFSEISLVEARPSSVTPNTCGCFQRLNSRMLCTPKVLSDGRRR